MHVRAAVRLLPLSLALALAACAGMPDAASVPADPPASPAESETARLNAWFDAKYEEALRFSPIQLTFLGRKDLNDKLDDFSEAGYQSAARTILALVDDQRTRERCRALARRHLSLGAVGIPRYDRLYREVAALS